MPWETGTALEQRKRLMKEWAQGARVRRGVGAALRRLARDGLPVAGALRSGPGARLGGAQPYSQPLAHAAAPNQVWRVDFKGWFRCGDGTRCDPLTITDAYISYLLRCGTPRRPTARTCVRSSKRCSGSMGRRRRSGPTTARRLRAWLRERCFPFPRHGEKNEGC